MHRYQGTRVVPYEQDALADWHDPGGPAHQPGQPASVPADASKVPTHTGQGESAASNGTLAVADETPQGPPWDAYAVKELHTGDRRLGIVGGTPEGQEIALSLILFTDAWQMKVAQNTGYFLVASLAPQARNHVTNPEVIKDRYQPYASRLTGNSSIFNAFTPEQVGAALGGAAAVSNPSEKYAYISTITSVTAALANVPGPDGNYRRPTPQQIRDGVAELSVERPDVSDNDAVLELLGHPTLNIPAGITTLSAQQRQAVRNAIALRVQNADRERGVYDELGRWMDIALQDPSEDPETPPPLPDSSPGNVALLSLGVAQTASGETLQAQESIVARGLLALLAQQTPWGKPSLIAIQDADVSNPDTLRVILEIREKCAKQRIPLILALGEITTESAVLLDKAALALMRLGPTEARILSETHGVEEGERLASISATRNLSTGATVSRSNSRQWDDDSGPAKSGGTSADASGSTEESYGETHVIEVGPQPTLPVSALLGIPNEKIAIISADLSAIGLFGLLGPERFNRTAFPPPSRASEVLRSLREQADRLQTARDELHRLHGMLTTTHAQDRGQLRELLTALDKRLATLRAPRGISSGPKITPGMWRQAALGDYFAATGDRARGRTKSLIEQWAELVENGSIDPKVVSWQEYVAQNYPR